MDIFSMRRPWPAVLVYALYGFLFGLAFPLGCLLLLVATGRVDADQDLLALVAQAHADQVLLYVVDTAPVVLALFAGFAGVRQDRIQRFNADLERQVADKTRDLWRALDDARQAHETVLHLAQHDTLTGLPNRSLLRQRLEQAIGNARSGSRRAALIFLDLDRFKSVNDALGHEAGDCLLREVANRLTRCVRADDTVARLGGDEFVIVLADLSQHGDAEAVLVKLQASLAEPMPIAGGMLVATASLGLAAFPEHGESGDALMRAADAAMYQVKTAGRNGVRVSDTCSPPAEAAPATAPRDDRPELSRAG